MTDELRMIVVERRIAEDVIRMHVRVDDEAHRQGRERADRRAQRAPDDIAAAGVDYSDAARADDEAHTLIRTALAGSGDIIPDGDTLHIRLDPLPAPRHTAAIDELCQLLNDTNTVYPDTGLTLRYSTKSHRRPRTNY